MEEGVEGDCRGSVEGEGDDGGEGKKRTSLALSGVSDHASQTPPASSDCLALVVFAVSGCSRHTLCRSTPVAILACVPS